MQRDHNSCSHMHILCCSACCAGHMSCVHSLYARGCLYHAFHAQLAFHVSRKVAYLLSMALMLQLQNFGLYMSQLGLQLSCMFGAGSSLSLRILSLLSHLQSA